MVRERTLKTKGLTGIDMAANSFESEEAARAFFEGLDFSVEQHSTDEVANELVSPGRLNLSPAQSALLEEVSRSWVTFVLRAKSTRDEPSGKRTELVESS
jgi:hypothetical protein